MNPRYTLFLALIIASATGTWPLVVYSADTFDTNLIALQKRIPVQLAQSLKQGELQKLLDSARRGITSDQMEKIRGALKRSGVLDELKGVGLSSIVLSPLEKNS
jgi:hypothetical protein